MSLTESETARLILALVLLLGAAHGIGSLFVRYRQPRVIGEILGGLLLGPTVFGVVLPDVQDDLFPPEGAIASALGAMYQVGLVLLLFIAGAEIGSILRKSERWTSAVIATTGMVIPFAVGILAINLIDLSFLQGPAQDPRALALVFGAAVAITSIPVISRIMMDLGIVHTPFGRIVLGAAVMEDIAMYAVLAVAVGLAQSEQIGLPSELGLDPSSAGGAAYHAGVSAMLLVVAMRWGSRLLGWLTRRRAREVPQAALAARLLGTLFVTILVCVQLGVTPVVGALAAGIMVGDVESPEVAAAMRAIKSFALAFFVPLYFAIVGLKLDLVHSFDPVFFLTFLVLACAVKAGSVYVGARLAGETARSSGNLAIALNARGGPGIVLASVAFDARIIDEHFYVSLVMLALVTSLIAGSWLERVVRSGRPLRAPEPMIAPIAYPAVQPSARSLTPH
jgi:Kef-type K+ transport system membrane component KefB